MSLPSVTRFADVGIDVGEEIGLTHVALRKGGGIAVVTLNRPDRLNAISHGPGSMADDLLCALRDADVDPAIGCIVVTGEGRAFSSGGDPGDRRLQTPREWMGFLEDNTRETDEIRGLDTPTIGAINGLCYGYGLVLATHLDLLIGREDAKIGLIETRFGSTGAQTLAFLVGAQWAKFLALSGEIITAARAKEIGLLLEVCAEDRFEPRVLDLARRISSMPRDAVVLNRRVINEAMNIMGWERQRDYAIGVNAVTNQHVSTARAADGRLFSEIREREGWTAYKRARDEPYTPGWLDDEP